MNVPLAILNGFDRSGTSMVAKLLAKHPDVELLFQPFNRTVFHETQWDIWQGDHRCPEGEAFFDALSAGDVDTTFPASKWFFEHSTVTQLVAGRLHVIKSTKLHFKTRWLRRRYPEIPFFGIYRDPRAVLCSLVRNGYHESWYGMQAFDALSATLWDHRELAERYGAFVEEVRDDPIARMALVLAVRTDVMGRELGPGHWIVYENMLRDPDAALSRFLEQLGCECSGNFSFRRYAGEDFNVVGKRFEKADLWRDYFPSCQVERLEPILFAWPGPECGDVSLGGIR